MFAWETKGPGLVFRTLGASGVGGRDLGLHPLPLSAPGLLGSSGRDPNLPLLPCPWPLQSPGTGSSPAGGSSSPAPRQGNELIISHPAGVLGYGEGYSGGSESCLPATLPGDPQGFSDQPSPSND